MLTTGTKACETMAADQLLRRQLDLARHQLQRVATTSEFYRDRGLSADVPGFDSVDGWPTVAGFTTKDQVLAAQAGRAAVRWTAQGAGDGLLALLRLPQRSGLAWSGDRQRAAARDVRRGLYTIGLRAEDLRRRDLPVPLGGRGHDLGLRRSQHLGRDGDPGRRRRERPARPEHRPDAHHGADRLLDVRRADRRVRGRGGPRPGRSLGDPDLVIVGEWHGSDAKPRLADIFGGAVCARPTARVKRAWSRPSAPRTRPAMHVHPDVLVEVRDMSRPASRWSRGTSGELVPHPAARPTRCRCCVSRPATSPKVPAGGLRVWQDHAPDRADRRPDQ